jgi:protein required for attachment to host cells
MGKYTAARDLDLSVKTRWYVVANRSEAVIYAEDRGQPFHFVERLLNLEGSLQEIELNSDRPGRGFGSPAAGNYRHGFTPPVEKTEHVAQQFAKRIAEKLRQGRNELRFRDVVLVAEPHFMGLLKGALDPATQAKVSYEVKREEYLRLPDSLMGQRIHEIMRNWE